MQMRNTFLFTHCLFFSIIILGFLYAEQYLAGDNFSLLFLFVFDLVLAIKSLSDFFKCLLSELYKQLSIRHAYRKYQFNENHISSRAKMHFHPIFNIY